MSDENFPMKQIEHYNGWPLIDELPSGWSFAAQCGSPLTGYAFAMSASPLRGGVTALVRVCKPQMQMVSDNQAHVTKPDPCKQVATKTASNGSYYDPQHAKTVNELARQKFKQRILNDILVDLTICEIEGWCKREYINELRELINSLGKKEMLMPAHGIEASI